MFTIHKNVTHHFYVLLGYHTIVKLTCIFSKFINDTIFCNSLRFMFHGVKFFLILFYFIIFDLNSIQLICKKHLVTNKKYKHMNLIKKSHMHSQMKIIIRKWNSFRKQDIQTYTDNKTNDDLSIYHL